MNDCDTFVDSILVNVVPGIGLAIVLIEPDPNLVDTIYEGDILTLTAESPK